MDALGRFGHRPYDLPWADVTLRRCNLQPADGSSFYDHGDYFAEFRRNELSDFGVPPSRTACNTNANDRQGAGAVAVIALGGWG